MITTHGATKGVTFQHNGDFSGLVHITLEADRPGVEVAWHPLPDGHPGGYYDVTIPFEDLKRLVAAYVLRNRVIQLENASDDAILLQKP